MRGHARMRDSNEKEIIAALKAAGATVTQLNGTGVPDLLVGHAGNTFLLEVKLPLGPRGGKQLRGGADPRGDGVLTESQVKWWGDWKGAPAQIVRSVDDALRAIGAR